MTDGAYESLGTVLFDSFCQNCESRRTVPVDSHRGWEDFVASYTELKDADEEGFTAILNPDEASSEDLFVRFKDGYSSAYFFIGQPWDWDE